MKIGENQVTLSERGLRSIEIASTYVQVLIGLASGIITAVLAVSPDLELVGLNSILLKVSLGILGSSIVAGLFGLGGLVGSTAESDEKVPKPLETKRVTIPTTAQLFLFGIGIVMMVIVFPTS